MTVIETEAARAKVVRMCDYFTPDELECKCCKQLLVEDDLLIALDNLRHEVGFPLVIESGYRCEARNKQVDGKPSSYHLKGAAVDIKIVHLKAWQVFKILKVAMTEFPDVPKFNGIGMGRNRLHLDVRKGEAAWTY